MVIAVASDSINILTNRGGAIYIAFALRPVTKDYFCCCSFASSSFFFLLAI